MFFFGKKKKEKKQEQAVPVANKEELIAKASTDLMKLYNKKRQEAAEAKDDEKVKEYMDKVQNLMQMSKDMIRGNA